MAREMREIDHEYPLSTIKAPKHPKMPPPPVLARRGCILRLATIQARDGWLFVGNAWLEVPTSAQRLVEAHYGTQLLLFHFDEIHLGFESISTRQ